MALHLCPWPRDSDSVDMFVPAMSEQGLGKQYPIGAQAMLRWCPGRLREGTGVRVRQAASTHQKTPSVAWL
eukprot:15432061-Alexandrium_andersonii.AAC.1